MSEIDLEQLLTPLGDRDTSPLARRTLPSKNFMTAARIVDIAVISMISISRLVPPALIDDDGRWTALALAGGARG